MIASVAELLHQFALLGVSLYLNQDGVLEIHRDDGKVPPELLQAVPDYYPTLVSIGRAKAELAWRNAVETNESYRFFTDLAESMRGKPELNDMWLEAGRSDEDCPKCRWDITFVEVDEANDSMVRRCAACGFSLGFLAWRNRQRLVEAIRQVDAGIRPLYDDVEEAGQADVGASDAPNPTTLIEKEAG